MNLKLSIFILLLFTATGAQASLFGWFSDDSESDSSAEVSSAISQLEKRNEPTQKEYDEIYAQVDKTLEEIESLLQAKAYKKALTAAKTCLDQTRVKTGIDPKAKFGEKLYVENLFSPDDMQKGFESLSTRKKEQIAKLISKHKGGYFLDLLNLSKRVGLFYLKAKLNVLKDNEKLTDLEHSQIVKSAIALVNIPIYIQDSKEDNDFLLFDTSVAQVEQIEMFNQELKDFITTDLKKSEKEFSNMLAYDKPEKHAKHDRGASTVADDLRGCIERLSTSTASTCNSDKYAFHAITGLGSQSGFCESSNINRDARKITEYRISQRAAARVCKSGQRYANCVMRSMQETKNRWTKYAFEDLDDAEKFCSANP